MATNEDEKVDRGDELPNADEAAEKALADEAAAAEEAQKAAAAKAEADAAALADKDKAGKDEGEETAEEKAEREKEEAAEAQKKRVRIPLERHEKMLDAARRREEALNNRIAELEKKTEAPRKDVLGEMKTRIAELQDKYEAHVFEGEKAEAKAVRAELEALREQYTDAKVSAVGNAARLQTIDQLKYDAALAKAEADHPAINPDHDSFDEEKMTEVAELLATFQARGLTRHAALEKAVKYALGAPKGRDKAGEDTAAQALAERRAQEARAKAAEAAKRQPPDNKGVGKDNDKAGGGKGEINVMKLSQEAFAKLDEEFLAKHRGDTL